MKTAPKTPSPGMKEMTAYALQILRYEGMVRLNRHQALLVEPSKVYYLWNGRTRSYEWYACPEWVLKSLKATPAMHKKARAVLANQNLPRCQQRSIE